jgi:CheY-like chemotaxis protein
MSVAIRILLIDDDATDRKAVRRALVASGLETDLREAVDGESGLAMIREAYLDCILLDYRLPDMDGLQVLRKLSMIGFLAPPVIVLTGLAVNELPLAVMEAGAVDYLSKSEITAPIIMRSVRYALARHEFRKAEAAARYRGVCEQKEVLAAQKALTGWGESVAAANSAQVTPMGERSAEIFARLEGEYGSLLDRYLEALSSEEPLPHREIEALAHHLGNEGAGARDVIDLHLRVTSDRLEGMNEGRARATSRNARLLALEVMGCLVDHYRIGEKETSTASSAA